MPVAQTQKKMFKIPDADKRVIWKLLLLAVLAYGCVCSSSSESHARFRRFFSVVFMVRCLSSNSYAMHNRKHVASLLISSFLYDMFLMGVCLGKMSQEF